MRKDKFIKVSNVVGFAVLAFGLTLLVAAQTPMGQATSIIIMVVGFFTPLRAYHQAAKWEGER